MSKILLLSTPLNEQQSGIALVDEPKAIQSQQEFGKKITRITGLGDQFWKSVGGIVWNPIFKPLQRNGIPGFSIRIPEPSNRHFSFVDGFNFPSDWSIEQKEEYVRGQVDGLLSHTAINTLWVQGDKKWDSRWKR